jgi:hypothetical protein
MAVTPRDVRPKRFAYFFLNGKLYKSKRAEKRNNMMYAYDAETHKLTGFLLSDVRALGQTAYRIGDVAELLGCSTILIRLYERQGKILTPPRWYKTLGSENGQRYYSPDMIRGIREFMSEVHMGRPRNDGMIVQRASLPSADELEAKLSHEDIFYVKDGDDFVPVWKAKF